MEQRATALERLGPEHLRAVAVGYRDALRAHREALNRLNVYPVPDGDTGTNMASTLEAVVAELDGAAGMAAVCKAISHGSLMGARGNSGVILSQVLRGLTEHLGAAGAEGADGPVVADALANASTAAYQAVMRPVEGTILTVVREAAEAAATCRSRGLVDVLDAADEAAHAAVARTPNLLAVLAEAGVVDAGGAGLALLFDVALQVVAGRPVPEPDAQPASPALLSRFPTETAGKRDKKGGELGPRYEVMFLLEAGDQAVAAMKESWAGLGDSIVVVGGDGTWNCHVHTDDVGAAVEAGVEAGRPHRIRVTDLHDQVAEEACLQGPPAPGDQAAGPPAIDDPPVVTAVVAVAAGEGVARILGSLGAHRVVPGGQAMNPSTAELLDAVEAVPGKEVVVLPNNKNVAAVAEQAAKLATKPVRVVGTVSVPQGFAALLAHDPEADAEANLASMGEAAGLVACGEITRAVRDAGSTPAGPVRKGDWLGITPGGIEVVGDGAVDAACALLERLVEEHHEIVTLVEGADGSPDDTRRITEWLAEHRPNVVVESHEGGQPLAAYLVSAE